MVAKGQAGIEIDKAYRGALMVNAATRVGKNKTQRHGDSSAASALARLAGGISRASKKHGVGAAKINARQAAQHQKRKTRYGGAIAHGGGEKTPRHKAASATAAQNDMSDALSHRQHRGFSGICAAAAASNRGGAARRHRVLAKYHGNAQQYRARGAKHQQRQQRNGENARKIGKRERDAAKTGETRRRGKLGGAKIAPSNRQLLACGKIGMRRKSGKTRQRKVAKDGAPPASNRLGNSARPRSRHQQRPPWRGRRRRQTAGLPGSIAVAS